MVGYVRASGLAAREIIPGHSRWMMTLSPERYRGVRPREECRTQARSRTRYLEDSECGASGTCGAVRLMTSTPIAASWGRTRNFVGSAGNNMEPGQPPKALASRAML